MDKNQINNLIEYWVKTSEEKNKSAKSLFSDKRYSDSLFYCHLTLEAIIKGLIVKNTGEHTPPIHNLLQLAERTGLDFTKEQLDDLAEITTFNISGRYDDNKFSFYKKATKDYTEKYHNKTQTLYLWIKEQLTK